MDVEALPLVDVDNLPPMLLFRGMLEPLWITPKLLICPGLYKLYFTHSSRFLLVFMACGAVLTAAYGGVFMLLLCPLLSAVWLSAAAFTLPALPVIAILGYFLQNPLSTMSGWLTSLVAEVRNRKVRYTTPLSTTKTNPFIVGPQTILHPPQARLAPHDPHLPPRQPQLLQGRRELPAPRQPPQASPGASLQTPPPQPLLRAGDRPLLPTPRVFQ